MCMDSYKYMFNNCRIPVKPADVEETYDPINNTHIAVVRNNKFYIVDTVHNGKQLSSAELETQFQRIIETARGSKALPIGVLTTENRDNWTDVSCFFFFLVPFGWGIWPSETPIMMTDLNFVFTL